MQALSSFSCVLVSLTLSHTVHCFLTARNFRSSAIYGTVSAFASKSDRMTTMESSSFKEDIVMAPATLQDVSSIVACTNDAYIADTFFKKPDYHDRFTEEDVREMINAPDSICIVAHTLKDRSVCGSLYLQWSTETPDGSSTEIKTVGKFSAVAVLRSNQKRGVGRSLIHAAEEHVMKIAHERVNHYNSASSFPRGSSPLGAAAVLMMGVINLREELFPWYESQGFAVGEKMPWDAELSRITKDGYEHVHLIKMQKTLL